MPRRPRGEKRAITSAWDDFIHRLEHDVAECRTDLELLESGQMQHRERRGDDLWVDTTQREIDWHKKTIGMYEGLIRKTSRGTRRIATWPANSPLAAATRRRMLHCDRLRSHAFVGPSSLRLTE